MGPGVFGQANSYQSMSRPSPPFRPRHCLWVPRSGEQRWQRRRKGVKGAASMADAASTTFDFKQQVPLS